MPGNRLIIGICSIGNVPRIYEKIIAGHITGFLRLDSRLLPTVDLPPSALAQDRMQYNAAALLGVLERLPSTECTKLIGITAADLFIPIFSHVYGEARQSGRAALVSTFRLGEHGGGPDPGPAVLYERTAKVAIHELGHLFDLVHCDDERCLMHFSGSLAELDRIELLFCRYCRAYLQDGLQRTDPRQANIDTDPAE